MLNTRSEVEIMSKAVKNVYRHKKNYTFIKLCHCYRKCKYSERKNKSLQKKKKTAYMKNKIEKQGLEYHLTEDMKG